MSADGLGRMAVRDDNTKVTLSILGTIDVLSLRLNEGHWLVPTAIQIGTNDRCNITL